MKDRLRNRRRTPVPPRPSSYDVEGLAYRVVTAHGSFLGAWRVHGTNWQACLTDHVVETYIRTADGRDFDGWWADALRQDGVAGGETSEHRRSPGQAHRF